MSKKNKKHTPTIKEARLIQDVEFFQRENAKMFTRAVNAERENAELRERIALLETKTARSITAADMHPRELLNRFANA